jgi:D-glycero-alpha-D-manno-heptose 1-phosphate guanylyltransferase
VADRPKPLAPVRGRPFLHYLIARLHTFRVDRLVLAVSYLHEQIGAYCGDGAQWGVAIRYAVEPVPRGTAGAVKQAAAMVDGADFLVLNGDSYVQVDYAALGAEHCQHRAELTLTLRPATASSRYGRVELDTAGRIVYFGEKEPEKGGAALINAGVYVMSRRTLGLIPDQGRMSLETELLPRLLQAERPIYGYRTAGYFRDIGIPEDYYQFIGDVAAGVIGSA